MKKLLLLLLISTPVFAQSYDYSYFTGNLGSDYAGYFTAPNGETSSYVSAINTIQFGGKFSTSGNVGVSYEDTRIKAWVTGYKDYKVGAIENPVDEGWRTPENLIGAITETDPALNVCCLGNGGSITLTFSSGISNGEGIDFAVFENAFGSNLELGFVEVSTNGIDFVRFPNFYLGNKRVYENLGDGNTSMNPINIYNLASKYKTGVGHGFDLQELIFAKEYIESNDCTFTEEFKTNFLQAFATLDMEQINYVRIVDIYGDGSVKDSIGHEIYDPTGGQYSSPGMDLKGIAVLNTAIIPEPAEYAFIFSFLTFVFLVYRKRK